MGSIASILCVCPDPVLQQTRRLILETYFNVDVAGRVSETAARLESRSYDLVVLCYSLKPEEMQAIATLARSLSAPPNLLALVVEEGSDSEAYSDSQISIREGPHGILKRVV